MSTKAVTLVTGGGRGIGRELALRISNDRSVLIVGRDVECLHEVCAKGTKNVVNYVRADLTSPEDYCATISSALERFGWHIESLVLNAGQWKHAQALDTSMSEYESDMALNFFANVRLIQAFAPGMIERGQGIVVANCGIIATQSFGDDSSYCASKHALMGFLKSFARETGKKGIRIIPFCTAYIESQQTEKRLRELAEKSAISYEVQVERISKMLPARRIISIQEFSETVALACREPTYFRNGEPFTFAQDA